MAEKKEKVGGRWRQGTAAAAVWSELEDGKAHTVVALKKVAGKSRLDWILYRIRVHLADKQLGVLASDESGESIKLKLGKALAEAQATDKSAAKKAKTTAKKESKKLGIKKPESAKKTEKKSKSSKKESSKTAAKKESSKSDSARATSKEKAQAEGSDEDEVVNA
ncbi:MAG: hypothetical protein KGL39_41040 [Patescibacteria group bacterium]|nr:hypothetical protein [Patescibacteria group bacterium]